MVRPTDSAGPGPKDETEVEAVYTQLRSLASSALSRQRTDHTLQPTALVHEAWMKLSRNDGQPHDRAHFLATATLAMRQVLQDHARMRQAVKRGNRAQGVTAEDVQVEAAGEVVDLVVLDDVLARLSELNERHGRIAELRILGGLTIAEVAAEIGVSERTVDSDWRFARAWLRTELGEQ